MIINLCNSEAIPVENYENELGMSKDGDQKSLDDERQYQELMSGIPDDSGLVNKDLEISDSDDEAKEVKERNIDVPEKFVQSNPIEMDDDDQDELWF